MALSVARSDISIRLLSPLVSLLVLLESGKLDLGMTRGTFLTACHDVLDVGVVVALARTDLRGEHCVRGHVNP